MRVVLAVAVLAVSALSSCANPCGELKTLCDKCTGAAGMTAGQAACNLTVTTANLAGSPQSCQAVLDAKTYASDGAACK